MRDATIKKTRKNADGGTAIACRIATKELLEEITRREQVGTGIKTLDRLVREKANSLGIPIREREDGFAELALNSFSNPKQ